MSLILLSTYPSSKMNTYKYNKQEDLSKRLTSNSQTNCVGCGATLDIGSRAGVRARVCPPQASYRQVLPVHHDTGAHVVLQLHALQRQHYRHHHHHQHVQRCRRKLTPTSYSKQHPFTWKNVLLSSWKMHTWQLHPFHQKQSLIIKIKQNSRIFTYNYETNFCLTNTYTF